MSVRQHIISTLIDDCDSIEWLYDIIDSESSMLLALDSCKHMLGDINFSDITRQDLDSIRQAATKRMNKLKKKTTRRPRKNQYED